MQWPDVLLRSLPRIYVYLDIDYSNVHLTYLYINPYRKIKIKKFNKHLQKPLTPDYQANST